MKREYTDVLMKAYAKKDNAAERKRKRLVREEAKIKKRLNEIEELRATTYDGYSWIDDIIWPIARELGRRLDRTTDVLGPFGMSAEVGIHLIKKGVEDKDKFKIPAGVLSLDFRPADLDKGEVRLVDRSKNTHRYAEGTLGEMNGMNYLDVPMPPKISDLVKLLKAQEKEAHEWAAYQKKGGKLAYDAWKDRKASA